MLIALVATVCWAIVAVVLGLPLIKAWVRRIERRGMTHVPPDASDRLARIEAAVDTIALEVERISEGQRYLTKLQTDKRIASEHRVDSDR